MTKRKNERVDEVSKYYAPIACIGKIRFSLFCISAIMSLLMQYSSSFICATGQDVAQAVFIVLVLGHFILSQVSRFHLVPRAERMRRKQLLSDAFGVLLSHDRTSLYYNNEYSPSLQRLAANTMENTLFSKEIAASMLRERRIVFGGYVAAWVLAFSLRHNDLHLLTWITQVVFSGEIIVGWLKLEVFRFRCQAVFDDLHRHFMHGIGGDSPQAVASVLDSFTEYEAAKSCAAVLLSDRVFNKLNAPLTEEWDRIRRDLALDAPRNEGDRSD